MLSTIITSILSGGVFGTVAGYLTAKFVEHGLAKDMERYRSELGERTEQLKTALSMLAHHESVRVTRVDAERAAAIEKLWSLVGSVRAPAVSLLGANPGRFPDQETTLSNWENDARRVAEACNSLELALAYQAIHIDQATEDSIAEFIGEARTLAGPLLAAIELGRKRGTNETAIFDDASAQWQIFVRGFSETLSPMIRGVVNGVRGLLGADRPAPLPIASGADTTRRLKSS